MSNGEVMGRGTLNCLEKRDLLNQSAVSVEILRQWGERYENEGFVHDAVDFYEKSGASEALKRLLEHALETGDCFLFGRIHRALNTEPDENELLKIAKQAEILGKHAFASQVYQRIGKEVTQEQVVGGVEPDGPKSTDSPESGQG